MTRSRIDVLSIDPNGRASWKTKVLRLGFGRDKHRFHFRIEAQEGNQFFKPRDRE